MSCTVPLLLPTLPSLAHSYAPERTPSSPRPSSTRPKPSMSRRFLELLLNASHHCTQSLVVSRSPTRPPTYSSSNVRIAHSIIPDKTSIDTMILLFMFTDTCEITGEYNEEREREREYVHRGWNGIFSSVFLFFLFIFFSLSLSSRIILRGGSCTIVHGRGNRGWWIEERNLLEIF